MMIVIPAALALLLGGLLLFLALAFPHSEDRLGLHEELLETRYQAAELVEGWLVAGAAEKKEWEAGISRLLERNHLRPRRALDTEPELHEAGKRNQAERV